MGIFDFVGFANLNSDFASTSIFCTTYGITIGNYQYYTIGNYQSNIIGTNIQTVVDPNALLQLGLNKLPTPIKEITNIINGVTGNTSLTVGDNNSFVYGENAFTVNRLLKGQIEIKNPQKPYLIGGVILLGSAAMLAANLALRILYGTDPSQTPAPSTVSEKSQPNSDGKGSTVTITTNDLMPKNNQARIYLALTNLISTLEGRWLWVLKSMEWVLGEVAKDLIPDLVDQLQNEVTTLKNKLTTLENTTMALTQAVYVLNNENAATTQSITDANLAITALQQKDNALEAKITTIEENIRELTLELTLLEIASL